MTDKDPVFRDCFASGARRRARHRARRLLRRVSRPARSPAAADPTSSQFVPRDAAVVAYANVHEIMTSELRQKLRRAIPDARRTASRSSRTRPASTSKPTSTRVVACLSPDAGGAKPSGAGMVLARGRFDEAKIEALMREHGAHVEDLQRQAPHRRRPESTRCGPDATDDNTGVPPSHPTELLPVVHRARPRRRSAARR